ncbi:Zinc finger, RING/FYVE/PHD-type [Balamuthia mandrillaris]
MRREPQRHHSEESQEGREEGQSSGLLASLRSLWRRAAAPSGAAAEDNEGTSYPGTRSSAYQRQPAAAATTQRRSNNNNNSNADEEWVLLNGRQPAATNENMSDEELARALQEQWEREAEEENRRTAARDALLARSLQNLLEQTQQHQEQEQTSSSSPPPRSRAQIEEDEALARRLQAEIEQSQNPTSSSPYSTPPGAQHSQPYVGPFGIRAERATGPRGEQVIRFSWGSNNRSGAPPRSSTSAPSLFGGRHLATEEEGDELAGLLGPYAELFQLIGMLQRQQAARATGREYGDEMGGSGGMTYEDLMRLAERLGDVNRGVDQRTFEELPTFSYQQPPKQSNNDDHAEGAVRASSSSSTTSNSADADEHRKQCIICLSDFEEGETLRTLPCLHVYHQACIDHWLRSRNTCPICKYEITRR